MSSPDLQLGEHRVLTGEVGRRALEWVRDHGWTPCLRVLVSTRAYTGRIDPEWVQVSRVKQGDGSPYPVCGGFPHGAGVQEGQWRLAEVLAVAVIDDAGPYHDWPEVER